MRVSVLVHFQLLTIRVSHGLSPSFLQENLKSNKGNLESLDKKKAGVMKGDPKCPNLVVSIVYDTKHVHYLSMVSSDLKWAVTEKCVFNVDMGRTETLVFLRMNTIHNYNLTEQSPRARRL